MRLFVVVVVGLRRLSIIDARISTIRGMLGSRETRLPPLEAANEIEASVALLSGLGLWQQDMKS